MKLIVACLVFVSVSAYQSTPTRREIFRQAFASAAFAGVAVLPNSANAIQPCAPKSKNCIVTEWTAPEGTSGAEMAKTIQAAVLEYPQEGQSDVDKGGWSLVDDSYASSGKVSIYCTVAVPIFVKPIP